MFYRTFVRYSKLRNKQKCMPLIRRQKFSMPVHEDGTLLVTIEIGKQSKRKSGNFLVGATDWFTSTPKPGSDGAMGAGTACCGTWGQWYCDLQNWLVLSIVAGRSPPFSCSTALHPKCSFKWESFAVPSLCLYCCALVFSLCWAKWNEQNTPTRSHREEGVW